MVSRNREREREKRGIEKRERRVWVVFRRARVWYLGGGGGD